MFLKIVENEKESCFGSEPGSVRGCFDFNGDHFMYRQIG